MGTASAAKEDEEPETERIQIAEGRYYSQIIKLKLLNPFVCKRSDLEAEARDAL